MLIFDRSTAADWRAPLGPGLGVEMGGHLGGGDVREKAVFRHLDMREPEDRIQDKFALVVVLPAEMIVTASETETATALGVLDYSHQVLRIACVRRQCAQRDCRRADRRGGSWY